MKRQGQDWGCLRCDNRVTVYVGLCEPPRCGRHTEAVRMEVVDGRRKRNSSLKETRSV
jgi:hypothetical protein